MWMWFVFTSSIFKAQVRKPPDVPQTDSVSNAGECKVKLTAPGASLILLLGVFFQLRFIPVLGLVYQHIQTSSQVLLFHFDHHGYKGRARGVRYVCSAPPLDFKWRRSPPSLLLPSPASDHQAAGGERHNMDSDFLHCYRIKEDNFVTYYIYQWILPFW